MADPAKHPPPGDRFDHWVYALVELIIEPVVDVVRDTARRAFHYWQVRRKSRRRR